MESFAAFERFFHLAPDLLAVVSLQGRFRMVNAAWEHLLGWEPADLIGREVIEFVPPEDVGSGIRTESVVNGRPGVRYTGRFRCRDGSHRWLEWVTEIHRDDGVVYAVARDITERVDAENALEITHRQIQLMIEHSPIGMALVALDGHFLSANAVLCQITGYTEDELTDRSFQDITHPDDLDADLALVQQLLDGEIPAYQLEKRYFDSQGRVLWVQLSASLLRDADDAPLYFIAQIEDIRERKRYEQELTHQAQRDQLTRLHNRAMFDRDLATHDESARRYGIQATLLVIDLNGFKAVNDAGGHLAGDAVLVAVADALRERLRATDVCYRIGGDEFAVILIGTSVDRTAVLTPALREGIARASEGLGDDKVTVTAAIGTAPIDGRGANSTVAAADAAMYADKRHPQLHGVSLDAPTG
jgi:diguanylate cyclase (GGDEF)-like protein/PAS domain S-box-containing protein